jgi:mannose-6-phosphate isomerase-like protein (cupin superfamily)
MELSPGRVVTAASVVDDLNTAMQWLSYPGRKNAVATAAEVDFGAVAAGVASVDSGAFDPSSRYVHLDASGQALPLPGGDAFWSLPEAELARFGEGWLVTEFECATDWPSWERHPAGDEFVYLLSGAATLLLELPAGVQRVPLQGRAAVLVPQGIWHTAEVTAPSRMLFITRGQGTEHRPVTNDI